MSGYLHRLVHTVSQPRPTVHPRTGSLFAPYRSAADTAPAGFETGKTVTTPPARSEASPAGETADTARPARSDDLQSTRLFGTTNERPRLFERGQVEESPQPASHEALHDALTDAIHAAQPGPAVQDSARQARLAGYELLIHPQPVEAGTTPETSRLSTEAGSKREAKANLTADGRSTRAEKHPDEIQIHIGRIEVTAVQPAAPRAPKALDKGISLDAYLERRNGRLR